MWYYMVSVITNTFIANIGKNDRCLTPKTIFGSDEQKVKVELDKIDIYTLNDVMSVERETCT